MAKLDTQNRAERVEVQPDARLRVSQVYDVLDYVVRNGEASFLADIKLPWGDPHPTYTNCRLVKQDVTGQVDNSAKQPNYPPPQLIRVWDQIPENDQVMVGNPDISYDQYGRKTVVIEYIQFSAGTSVYSYVVGSTAAPVPNSECILKTYESTNDGTLITKKITFIDSGQLADDENYKFGGNVIIRTLTYLNEVPPTPAGYSLVTRSTEYIEGLPIYRYGFVKAAGAGGGGTEGIISQSTEYKQSIDQGTNGVTVTTIKKVTPDSVTTNPIATPSGFALIDVQYADEDGFRLWTAVYAKGAGQVDLGTEINNCNKLYLYHKIGLGSAPSTPGATIGGTVTLISTDVRNADGYVIYDYRWAEGNGEISRDIDYSQSTDQGTTGITRTTIRHLVAPTATVEPTSLAGSVEIGRSFALQDGYKIWTTVWAKGTGLVAETVETKNDGKLKIYRKSALGTAPTAPAATIGGTVVLIEDSYKIGDGVVLYDRTWAEGNGIISNKSQTREDGSIAYTVVELDAAAMTPASPEVGTRLVALDQDARDGYYLNTATYIKPPPTTTLKKIVSFKMPGLAEFSGNNLIITPPSDRTLEANQEISYDTTQNTDVPYSVAYGAYLRESYIRTNNNGVGEYRNDTLSYIVAGAAGISGTNDYYNGVLCDEFDVTLNSSSPTARPSGLTVIDKDNSIYLIALDGTIIYRRVKVTYTF